jgi:murein DD-endopeptidase MepM/ murein hydrolase activator NlpD
MVRCKLQRQLYLFGFLLNTGLSILLYSEWQQYRELTASLLELQAVYESYRLMAERADQADLLVPKSQETIMSVEPGLEPIVSSVPEPITIPLATTKPKKRRVRRQSTATVVALAGVEPRVENAKAIFSWPLERSAFWISSFFGPRKLGRTVRMHTGIDLAALKGTPVMAAGGAKVLAAGYVSGYGNMILLRHNRKYRTRYAHLNSIRVQPGEIVKRGQVIGTVGHTGFVQAENGDASHLHFEVYAFDKHVNPIRFLPKR